MFRAVCCQSAAAHTKTQESLPEYGVEISVSLFAGTEVNFKPCLTQRNDKKYVNIRRAR